MGGGPNVRGRFQQDKVVFERAAAICVMIRRGDEKGSAPAGGLTVPGMEEAILASSGVQHLERGGWEVEAALKQLFRLQREFRSSRTFKEEDVCVSDEDGNSCKLVGWVGSINERNKPATRPS